MITKELVEYIKGELTRGIPRETLMRVLVANGWNKQDIEEALGVIKPSSLGTIVPKEERKEAHHEKKVVHEAPKPFSEEELGDNPLLTKPNVKNYVWQPAIDAKKGDGYSAQFATPVHLPKKMSVLKKMLITIVGIVLLAGGVYAYLRYSNYAERLIRNTLGASEEVKSFQFKIQAEIKPGEKKNFLTSTALLADTDSFRLALDGAVDAHDNTNPATLLAASVSAPVLFDAPVIFEMRFTDGIFYIRVPETDLLDLFISKEAKPDTNTWISFSENDAGSLKNEKPAIGDLVSVSRALPQELFSSSALTDFKQIVVNFDVLKKFSFGGSETLEGVSTYKVNFSVDVPTLQKMLRETATVHEESKEGLLAIAAALEGVAIPDGSVWIGSNDKLVHKIAFTTVSGDESMEKTVSQFVIRLTDFNKNIRIDPPSPSLSAVSLLTKVEQSKGKERTRQLLSAAPFTASVYVKTHNGYTGLCSSAQGFRDLALDIAKSDKTLPSPTCRSSKTGWVFFAPYGGTDAYWCIDSTGTESEVTTKPTKMVCK